MEIGVGLLALVLDLHLLEVMAAYRLDEEFRFNLVVVDLRLIVDADLVLFNALLLMTRDLSQLLCLLISRFQDLHGHLIVNNVLVFFLIEVSHRHDYLAATINYLTGLQVSFLVPLVLCVFETVFSSYRLVLPICRPQFELGLVDVPRRLSLDLIHNFFLTLLDSIWISDAVRDVRLASSLLFRDDPHALNVFVHFCLLFFELLVFIYREDVEALSDPLVLDLRLSSNSRLS